MHDAYNYSYTRTGIIYLSVKQAVSSDDSSVTENSCCYSLASCILRCLCLYVAVHFFLAFTDGQVVRAGFSVI